KMGWNTSKDGYKKSEMNKAWREVDKAHAKAKMLEVGQSEAKSVLSSLNIPAAKLSSTAVRGYSHASKGYEIRNSYDPALISFHKISEGELQKISDKLTEQGIKHSLNLSQGNITLKSQGDLHT